MASAGPCDLYASGSTPCVAAHSTVRALYGAYGGMLYQVKRASDKTTKDIGVLTSGGFADAAAQDTFCAGTTCTISILYDQSPKGNHLRSAPAGGAKTTPDNEANATALKLTVSGHSVYGVHIPAGIGYRNDKTAGIATGDAPETEYMVTSGNYYNGGLLLRLRERRDEQQRRRRRHHGSRLFREQHRLGQGRRQRPVGHGGPRERALCRAELRCQRQEHAPDLPYVTAMVKGRIGRFALKGGNAQSGTLTTLYDGARPTAATTP